MPPDVTIRPDCEDKNETMALSFSPCKTLETSSCCVAYIRFISRLTVRCINSFLIISSVTISFLGIKVGRGNGVEKDGNRLVPGSRPPDCQNSSGSFFKRSSRSFSKSRFFSEIELRIAVFCWLNSVISSKSFISLSFCSICFFMFPKKRLYNTL